MSSTTSRILLNKNQHCHQFLTWIAGTWGSPLETRGVRVTWEGLDKSKSLDKSLDKKGGGGGGRIIKSIIKLGNGPVAKNPIMKTKMKDYPGLIESRRNVFEKTDFTLEDSKWMINDMLKNYWNAVGKDDDAGLKNNVKLGFLRPVPELANDKVIVEFGSPNIAKPLHMGHLRSLVTGHFTARICKAAGHNVTSICFLGDWGTQFGILQAGLSKYLPAEDANANKNVLDTVNKLSLDELLRYYVRAVQETEKDEEFFSEALKLSAALEQGDPDCLRVWESIREKTLNHLKSFWSLFDVKYDVIQGESEFTIQNALTEKALQELTKLGIIQVADDRCVYVVLPPDSKFSMPIKIPLVKKDGTSLYLLRDVACAISRKEKFEYDRMIYVVDKTQAHHFISLFRILEELKIQENKYSEDDWDKKLWHVTFGKVEGMSTRSGNFVLLSDVIATGSSIMQENRMKSPNARNVEDVVQVSTQLAISALIVYSLKVRRNRDVAFDWNDALNPTGDTGVNLQYTHARLMSLENNVKQNRAEVLQLVDKFFHNNDIDQILGDPFAWNLIIQLVNFEDAFWSSYAEMEPCILLNYLFKLGDKVSKALKHLKVSSEPDEKTAASRLALFVLSRRIMAIGLNTLGIQPLNEI